MVTDSAGEFHPDKRFAALRVSKVITSTRSLGVGGRHGNCDVRRHQIGRSVLQKG
jgi:hypothetical protein